MDLEKIKQNTIGMILQFSIPAIIAMVLTSLITVVDGFFIGNFVGEEGIAAVNLGLDGIRWRGCDCGHEVWRWKSSGMQSGVSANDCDYRCIFRIDGDCGGIVF